MFRSLVFALAFSVQVAWGFQWDPDLEAKDVTDIYNQAFKSFRGGNELLNVDNLRNNRVLLVRGWLADHRKADGSRQNLAWGYYDDQIQLLEELQIPYELVEIITTATFEENGAYVINAIERSDRPVIIFGHSQGGLSGLFALLERPDLQPKVKGFVAMQSPFRGTPVADVALNAGPISYAIGKAIGFIGGDVEGLREFTTRSRLQYNKIHQFQIQELLKLVPVLCLTSWIDNKFFQIDTTLEVTRNFLNLLGFENDGLVPWESAVLQGSNFVSLPGIDHLDPVVKLGFAGLDRRRFSYALLSTVVGL